MTNSHIRAKRETLILDHFHDEVAQRWDDVLSTFEHPRYEIIPTMVLHDGQKQVRDYYHESRTAFPDQDHEIIALRHADDAVIVEFWLMGTHLGPISGIPPTGSKFRVRMTAFFIFDSNEKLVCERIYFDSLSMIKQLLGSLNYKNPKNWWLLIKALKGFASAQAAEPPKALTDTSPPEFPNYTHRPINER